MPKIFGVDRIWTHYDAVVGNTKDATSAAQYSTIQAAINAVGPGARVLILKGTYTENISITQNIYLVGQGQQTLINGTLTLAANYCTLSYMRFNSTMTFSAGSTGNFVHFVWQATGQTVTNSGTNNEIIIIQE